LLALALHFCYAECKAIICFFDKLVMGGGAGNGLAGENERGGGLY